MTAQSEVKEYFIDTDSYANPSDSMVGFESMTSDMIHVILKSEYDKLKEENQDLQTLLGECEGFFEDQSRHLVKIDQLENHLFGMRDLLQKIKAARGSNEQIP